MIIICPILSFFLVFPVVSTKGIWEARIFFFIAASNGCVKFGNFLVNLFKFSDKFRTGFSYGLRILVFEPVYETRDDERREAKTQDKREPTGTIRN